MKTSTASVDVEDRKELEPGKALLNGKPKTGRTGSISYNQGSLATVEVEGKNSKPKRPKLLSLDERYGFWSQWSFGYLSDLVSKAQTKMLLPSDLNKLGDEDHSEIIQKRFEKCWQHQQERARETGDTGAVMLLKSFYNMQPRAIWLTVLLELVTRGALFATPFVLDLIIRYLEDKGEQGIWYAVLLCILMGACIAISGIAENRMQAMLARISFNMQASIMGQIYMKYFRLDPDSLAKTGTGQVLNMIGEDTQRIFQLMPIINYIWSAPLQMIVVAGLLVVLVGWAPTLGAIGVLAVVVVAMRWSNDKMQVLEKQRAVLMDTRIKLITELISGMKVVKLYSWEEPMKAAISKERIRELTKILHIYLLRALNVALFNMAPVLMSVVIFYIFIEAGGDLDPALVFGTIALVNLVRAPLIILPILQTAYNSSRVSFGRIHQYLILPERAPAGRPGSQFRRGRIKIDGGVFEWPRSAAYGRVSKKAKKSKPKLESKEAVELVESKEKKREAFVLRLSCDVKAGELVQIIGPVGAGKSSALSAILGNMNGTGSGKRDLSGSVAYVPQHPWVMNKTLKENILFGKEFDQGRYDHIIWLCALGADLKQLPNGDMTIIGEQGINLSGGQKQRVALARAVYADADVYLLDDPLSAVDQHVAAHIFFCTIQHYLKAKTVVLATHQVQFLRYASKILVLDSGSITAEGTYDSLRSEMEEYPQVSRDEWVAAGHSVNRSAADAKQGDGAPAASPAPAPAEEEKVEQAPTGDAAIIKVSDGEDGSVPPAKAGGGAKGDAKAAPAGPPKFKPKTGMPWSVHMAYFNAAGPKWVIISLLFFFIFTQLTIMSTEYWMAAWTGDFFNKSDNFYMMVYGLLALGSGIITFIRIFMYAFSARQASKNIHSSTIETLMDATMRHFDVTPMGAITALFARDQSMIDTFLPELYNVIVTLAVMLVVSLLAIAIIIPWFFLTFVPILYIAWRWQSFALPAVGNVTILNLMSLGPVFSFYQESMSGLAVIRSADKVDESVKQVNERIDALNNSYYHSQLTTKWLDIRMDLVSGVLLTCSAICVVLTKGIYSVELGALVLTYSLGTGTILGFMVQIRAYLEMMLTAVERCDSFKKNTPKERFTGSPTPKNWPEDPTIEFEAVDFRYGDQNDQKGPLVLKNLTFKVPKSKRIAIIGRTGAGKTSLTAALLRINEAAAGRVVIGGRPTHDIPLRTLRSRIAIIPQDPVLFTGTIRFNLDPFNAASDEKIWTTLGRVQLTEIVRRQPGELNAPVRENGSNFSVGQRQLFCVARAMLTASNILIMDEATASVDYGTDSKIQAVIRKEFAHCTVLTIAHRIKTIIDYDLILALDKGSMAEFDSPAKLLEDSKSYFSELLTEEQREEKQKNDKEKENAKTS